MAVRLSGVFDPEGKDSTAAPAGSQWEERYPAPPPWRRLVRRFSLLRIVLDISGESSTADCLSADDDGQLGVAGSIRLDRRDELIARLGIDGARVGGDAALALEAYRRWRGEAFSRLEGDFAFVVWDLAARTIFLVRDPFGVRRLHYAALGSATLFSTDVEGVLAWPQVDRTPDDVTILGYFLGRYSGRERTFFRAVKRVQCRHVLRVQGTQRRMEPTRQPSPAPEKYSSLEEYAEDFQAVLRGSTEERLTGTAAALCHVSGGLDSASVASLAVSRMASSGAPRIVLASARFPGAACDEGGAIHELGRWLGMPIREWNGLEPETSDLANGRLAWPLGRSSSGGSRQGDVEIAASERAGVLLSGWGGNQVASEDGFLRDAARTGGIKGYLQGLRIVAANSPWRWSRRALRRALAVAKAVAKSDLMGMAPPPLRAPSMPSWFRPKLAALWGGLAGEREQPAAEEPRTGSWTSEAVWSAMWEDPNDVWTVELMDARACERGLEFRHPYLSWALVSVAMSVPWRLRAPTIVDRPLQRLALRGVLPERLRWRDTYLDFTEAFLANTVAARPLIEELLLSGPWMSDQFVDRAVVVDEFRRLTSSPLDGAPPGEVSDAWQAVKDVAALEAWLRRL